MQGPINKEPEDKLDPSSKASQSPSGIRRLYVVVVDSKKFIAIVVDLQLDVGNIFCCSMASLVYSYYCKARRTLSIAASSASDTSATVGLVKSTDGGGGRDVEAGKPLNSLENLFASNRADKWNFNSFRFSLVVLMLNIYYLLICVYMNKFLINFLNYLVKLVSCDIVLAAILVLKYKCSSKLKATTLIAVTTLLALVYSKLPKSPHFSIK